VSLKTIFGVNPDPAAKGAFDGPDNITVSPFGGVILAADGDGIQHLVGVDRRGVPYALARNELNDSEFAGPTFSQDNRILFANIQSPGSCSRSPGRRANATSTDRVVARLSPTSRPRCARRGGPRRVCPAVRAARLAPADPLRAL
jgi:secreted PhoX family phosphatase